ncbi:MAG: FAD binding domain-containing protein, partial [Alphaproteobacteria bacterium]
MELLPDFDLVRPPSVDEALVAWREAPEARYFSGGTDLLPNMRRGFVETPRLIDLSSVEELRTIEAGEEGLTIGAAVTLDEVAAHPALARDFGAVAQAAASVAGPTQRLMGTVGGNLCLDTRCYFYNQSEWWRRSIDYCLKYRGEICHVVPSSKRCYAAYSGDLAPALLVLGAELEVAGPEGRRRFPLDDLFVDDGMEYLTLRKGELVVAVRVPAP